MDNFPMPERVAVSVPEGKIVDFLTGAFRADTAEEYVRQNVEKALVRQYRFLPKQCAPEYPIRVGSSRKRVDIAIFVSEHKIGQEHIRLIVETKRADIPPSDQQNGIGQLQSYLAACPNALYGIWTNGDERYCYKKVVSEGVISFAEITDVPSVGQSEEDAQRPKRKDLTAATGDNLLFTFRRCHNYIASAEGLQKQDAFWELLKIIFCKIEDERSRQLEFFATPIERRDGNAAGVAKARLRGIFEKKVLTKYPEIFQGKDAAINLGASSTAFVVSELQRYSLLNSPVDVKGVAYEEIVGSNLRGDRGEFFTPRNACRMAVEMVSPKPEHLLLDPACGTGGFLITAMNEALAVLDKRERESWIDRDAATEYEREEWFRKRKEYFNDSVRGFDLNPSLVRAAKMNMVMNNDGEGGLHQANSLENPRMWSAEAQAAVQLGTIDCVFTNPPFGANIIISDRLVLQQYELARLWDWNDEAKSWNNRRDKDGAFVLQRSLPPEILFVERCVQFLKAGTGVGAIVLPNGILNNPALAYVRHWLLTNVQIIAVVDMARELFQPKNDTQTSMLVFRKLSTTEREDALRMRLDYEAFLAIAGVVGHDKRGNAVYRRLPDGTELLSTRKERVVNKVGDEEEFEVAERVVADDLPLVADAFRLWLRSH
jgi:type I restriction enzyme M protein